MKEPFVKIVISPLTDIECFFLFGEDSSEPFATTPFFLKIKVRFLTLIAFIPIEGKYAKDKSWTGQT